MAKRDGIARTAGVAALVAAAFALGCAKAPVVEPPPPPLVVQLAVSAGSDLNPDLQGRPSPVLLRIYQLKDAAAFGKADFFALWDREAETLGPSLSRKQELPMVPGGSSTAVFEVEKGATQLGIAAAFRDIRGADWRAVVPIGEAGTGARHLELDVKVGARSVTARLETQQAAEAKK